MTALPSLPSTSTPLSELSPNSLDEYFSRDPNDLSDQDIVVIVTELRRKRASWAQDEQAKKTGTKAPKQKLSLKDLGLT